MLTLCPTPHEETGVYAPPVLSQPFALTRTGVCSRRDTKGDQHWSLGFRFHVSVHTPVVKEADQNVAWFTADELPSSRADDLDIIIEHLNGTCWT